MRRYVVFSAVSLALVMYAVSMSSVSVAFPVIIEKFDTTLVLAGWVLTAFQLVSTIIMPLSGKISEILGEKSSFLLYVFLFTAGSVFCALAPNIEMLIVFRVVQAMGGGGLMPCASAIVSNEFPESRQRYIGLFSSIFPVGMIIGPNLGGYLVEVFGWNSVFWFNVPLGILVIGLSWFFLRTGKKTRITRRSFDFIGSGLMFGTLLALMSGLTTIGNSDSGISWLPVGLLFTVAISLLIVFIRREFRVKEPIIDLELLKRKPFFAANMYNVIYGLAAMGVMTLVPLYAVTIYDMSILESGVILTSRSIGMMIASTITSIYIVKWGYRWPIIIGTLGSTLGLFLLSIEFQGINLFGFHLGPMALLLIILGICGMGHGICAPASNNACIELLPDKVATIVGLRGMFRQMGAVFGISISTVVIHLIVNKEYAFHVVFLAATLLTLVSIPWVFAMPRSPTDGVQIASKKQSVDFASTNNHKNKPT